jgi:multiple sugar transport system substrate-binding protein
MISIPAQEQIMDGEYSPEHDAYYPFRTPIRLDMVKSEFFTSNSEYISFLSGFEFPSIDVPVPAWQTVKDSVFAPGLHKVMTGVLSVDDFLSAVETEGNKILSAG